MDTVIRFRRTWDWIAGIALIGLAALVLIVGSVATAGAHHVADQLCLIISAGLGGLLLLGAGSTLMISAGLSDEGRKLDRLEGALPFRLPAGSLRSTADVLRQSRIIAGVGMVMALAFVVAAWRLASGAANPNPTAFRAAGTGAVGLVAEGVTAALATMSVKRNIQLRKSRLLAPWSAAQLVRGFTPPSGPTSGSVGAVVVASGLTRFHAAGCLAVADLITTEVNAADLPPGLTPCELCHVDAAAPAGGAPSVLAEE